MINKKFYIRVSANEWKEIPKENLGSIGLSPIMERELIDCKKEDSNSFNLQMEQQAREELSDAKNYIGARKYDSNKIRFDLIPIECIEYLAKVYTMGANKYGDNNWQGLDNFEDRYYSALMRHLSSHRKGEMYDDESGYLHIGHAAWNAIALLWYALKEEKSLEDYKYIISHIE